MLIDGCHHLQPPSEDVERAVSAVPRAIGHMPGTGALPERSISSHQRPASAAAWQADGSRDGWARCHRYKGPMLPTRGTEASSESFCAAGWPPESRWIGNARRRWFPCLCNVPAPLQNRRNSGDLSGDFRPLQREEFNSGIRDSGGRGTATILCLHAPGPISSAASSPCSLLPSKSALHSMVPSSRAPWTFEKTFCSYSPRNSKAKLWCLSRQDLVAVAAQDRIRIRQIRRGSRESPHAGGLSHRPCMRIEDGPTFSKPLRGSDSILRLRIHGVNAQCN
jgi:hypothetical protein